MSADPNALDEDGRHADEVKHVIGLADKETRQKYLNGVRHFRGDAAVQRIKDSLHAYWREKQGSRLKPKPGDR